MKENIKVLISEEEVNEKIKKIIRIFAVFIRK